MNRFHIEQL